MTQRVDQQGISRLQSLLHHTDDLSDKSVEILNKFDDRMHVLENILLPVHNATRKLALLHQNIDTTQHTIHGILDLYDLPQELGPIILKGTDVPGMAKYMEHLGRIKQANQYLTKLNFENSEAVVRELKALETQGLQKLGVLFRVLLQSHSQPFDVKPFSSSAIPPLPTNLIQNLARISGYLLVGEGVDFGEHVQGYIAVRVPYLVRLMQPLSVPQPPRNDTYMKGTSPLLLWTKALGVVIKAEYEVADSVLPDPHNVRAFQQSISGIVSQYTEAVDTLLQRVKRNAANRDFREFWLLLDLIYTLDQTLVGNLNQTILVDSGSSGKDLQELLNQAKLLAQQVLGQILTDLREGKAIGPAPTDGSIHEWTGWMLANLRHLAEYEAVDGLLANMNVTPPLALGGPAAKGGRLGKYCFDCLDMLTSQLDAKSKGLKPGLAAIFSVNNSYYLSKQLKQPENAQVANAIQAYNLTQKLDGMYTRGKQGYEETWKPCLDPLRDDPSRQPEAASGLQPPLSRSLRDAVKERIGAFNTGCEQRLQSQKSWMIPDVELRSMIVRDVKQMVVPLYQTFYDRYTALQFTKNPEKHIRWQPHQLDQALNVLFNG